MSLTRAAHAELCGYIQEKCSAVLGNKFWDCRVVLPVDCGSKPDKLEPRILAVSKFRIFILHGKTVASLKVDRYLHLLLIRTIQIINDNEVCLGLDESTGGKRRLFVHVETSSRELALHLLAAIKHYFPDISDILKSMIELIPSDLYAEFANMPLTQPTLACHNFRRSYAALCDFHEQPFRDEVVWDIEKIYASHHLRVLRLDDFTHLLPRDLVPILAVCQYSQFFTGICVEGTKLVSELVDIILAVVRRSPVLSSLVLRNCSLPKDFVNLFATALQSNISIPLETIDFSKNLIDDKKGFVALSVLLPKMTTLKSCSFSDCLLSEKCVNLVASGLLQGLKLNTGVQKLQPVELDFSGNSLKDDINDVSQLLSLCTSLRSLSLSDTGCSVDKLWASLRFGGLQLETLKLSGCQSNRRNKDSVQYMKEFFSTAVGLKHIDFSNTNLGSETLKALFYNLLLGLASNQQLKPFTLLLDGVCDRGVSQVLETCLGGVDVRTLSLRDNGLEADSLQIVSACSSMPHLTRLDLSGANFSNLRKSAKHHNTLNSILLEIVKLIGEDDSKLNELVLADCRLSTHLSVLLNTLGVASSLRYLDITGNEMGNFGARLFAKALQINVSLRTVLIDRNQITGDGFADIAQALKLNSTLLSFPYPVNDAADSLSRTDRAKTLAALSDIEASTERNRAGIGKGEAHYRTMLTSLQQELFGRSNGSEKFAEMGEKFSCAVEALLLKADTEQQLHPVVEQSLQKLEERVLSIAKGNLEPMIRIGEAEGIECVCAAPDQNTSSRETLLNAVEEYLNEMKWKMIGRTIEQILVDFRNQTAGDDKRSISSSSQTAPLGSPRDFVTSSLFTEMAQRCHRPKSVITEFCNGEAADRKVSFDAPPLPSPLSHLVKSRPKPSRIRKPTKEAATKSTASSEESTDTEVKSAGDGDMRTLAYDGLGSVHLSPDPEAPCSRGVVCDDKVPVAMPRTTSMQPPSRTSPTISSSPTAPPIVPRRNRVGPTATPPMLPPKPDSTSPSLPPKPDSGVLVRPASCGIEDSDEKSRRSVADMARMFSSSESPFSGRRA